MNPHEDHSIPGLPQYPIDPSLPDSSTHSHPHAIHAPHQHHHQHDLDVEAEAALAADFFGVADDTTDLSLAGATLEQEPTQIHVHELSAEVPFLPTEHEMQTYQPPKKKKLQLACQFCRRRKLKCDGVTPACENCVKRNENCIWDDTIRRRGPGKRTKALRDRAVDTEASAASLHGEIPLLGDSSSFSDVHGDDTAASVADTNAALIAAVTAAAAEGHVGDDGSFGGEHLADINVHDYAAMMAANPHIGKPIGEAPIPGVDASSRSLDPNIDPSLAELAPSTLAELTGGSSAPASAASRQSQPQRPMSAQPQQHQRKMPGVGVGVGVGVGLGVGVGVQPSNFNIPQAFQQQIPGGANQAGAVAGGSHAAGGVEGEGAVDGTLEIDWDKGYGFSSWPDLDIEPK